MQPNFRNEPRLYPYEWAIVLLFCGSVSLLAAYSYVMAEYETPVELGEAGWVKSSLLTLSIAGAVSQPGDYQIERGSTVREALEMASPLAEADLSRINLDKKIIRKQRIYVPLKKIKRKMREKR